MILLIDLNCDNIEINSLKISNLIKEMITYNSGDSKRIQHSIKVHNYCRTIAVLENVDLNIRFILETAAILHDIGIKICEEKYGECGSKLQEKEGPAIAKSILISLNFDNEIIERVCFLVSHHHSYKNIHGLDYQILVESDFLVNLDEENSSKEAINSVYNRIFKTETGKYLCKTIFNL